MKISFIIPTYNEAKGIEETLRQFQEQRRQGRIEVIVTDNGSSDNTVMLAKPLADRVVTLPADIRTTIGECRNRGVKAALSDIVWCSDADVLIPHLYEVVDEVTHQFEKDARLVAMTLPIQIYPAEARWSDRFWFGVVNVLTWLQNSLLQSGAAPGDCQIIRRSTFEQVHGYDPHLRTSEDHDLFHKLIKRGTVKMLWHRSITMSARRVHRDGWPKILWLWGRNWTRQFILHQSDTTDWEPRR